MACGVDADGEGVWSWHPWAGVKFADGNSQATVTKRSWTPGRARNKSKTVAQGMPMFWLTCSDYARVLFSLAHEAMGAAKHLAFPAPSIFEGGRTITRAFRAAGLLTAACALTV